MYLIFIVICITFAASQADDPCICNKNILVVCGTDGQTYTNPCRARCKNAEVASMGACPGQNNPYLIQIPSPHVDRHINEPCICTKEIFVVCGTDGTTYTNPCRAKCNNAMIASIGACPGDANPYLIKIPSAKRQLCLCPAMMNPVCGEDGVTYDNAICAKNCGGVNVLASGPCADQVMGKRQLCLCPATINYVCGEDGVTYDNAICAKNCGGVNVATSGTCADQMILRSLEEEGIEKK